MSLSTEHILKCIANTGYFQSTGYNADSFRLAVEQQLRMAPDQAFQALVKAGYVEIDHGPNPHPVDYADHWRLTLTKEGVATLLAI